MFPEWDRARALPQITRCNALGFRFFPQLDTCHHLSTGPRAMASARNSLALDNLMAELEGEVGRSSVTPVRFECIRACR